jgi:hypothetical protein
VEQVSWNDIQEYIQSSTRQTGKQPTDWPAKPNGNTQPGRAALANGALETTRASWVNTAWYSANSQSNVAGGPEEAQRIWAARHARQRVGVGARRAGTTTTRSADRRQRMDCGGRGIRSRTPRRFLVQLPAHPALGCPRLELNRQQGRHHWGSYRQDRSVTNVTPCSFTALPWGLGVLSPATRFILS